MAVRSYLDLDAVRREIANDEAANGAAVAGCIERQAAGHQVIAVQYDNWCAREASLGAGVDDDLLGDCG